MHDAPLSSSSSPSTALDHTAPEEEAPFVDKYDPALKYGRTGRDLSMVEGVKENAEPMEQSGSVDMSLESEGRGGGATRGRILDSRLRGKSVLGELELDLKAEMYDKCEC